MEPELQSDGPLHTIGIIVTYRPDHVELLNLVEAIRPQLDMLLVIDNGDGSDLPDTIRHSDLKLICLGDNHGIARAQNVGIQEAFRCGGQFVLLLDQDSLPAPDMVERLATAYDLLTRQRIRVAAVGPRYLDPRQGDMAPFVYREGWTLKRRVRDATKTCTEADFLIASGCLINAKALTDIGLMQEGLFIDYVDIEWGLRARHLGFRNFGVHDAMMSHSLGDEWIEFRGRRVPVHSPLRHYYHFRNAIWLARQKWIGWPWRVILLRRLVLQFGFFSLLAGHRRDQARMMLIGCWHGIRGVTGRFKG